jgi:ABC-type polysaccharide/polyol phosphate transport system ATPase subunit
MVAGPADVPAHNPICRGYVLIMGDEPIIEVKGLWKRYGLPPFLPWKKKQVQDHEWALRDITFSVPRGGSLGILGRNGAGKSTLLKILAGVTPPDRGETHIRGKVFPMIELNAGMSMELSGQENIKILGTIMGLSTWEIEELTPKVEEFSELEDWLYKPVWQYSSGMLGRLAFGIAVHIRADILLVDEVLSTGDIMFQKKCQSKVEELLGNGATLIFVSHSPYQIEKLCDNGLLLEKGTCDMHGKSHEVMQEYLMRTTQRTTGLRNVNLEDSMDTRQGTGSVRVTGAYLADETGALLQGAILNSPLTVYIHYIAKESLTTLDIALSLYTENDTLITIYMPQIQTDGSFVLKKGRGVIKCEIPHFPVMGIGLYFDICFSTTAMFSHDYVKSAIIFDAKPSPHIINSAIYRYRGLIDSQSSWYFTT